MKTIHLTNSDLVVTVSDKDYPKVRDYSWRLMKGKTAFYAVRNDKTQNRTVYMQREIMGCRTGDRKLIDFVDGNPLNCARSNLRFSTQEIVSKNREGVEGVWWDSSKNMTKRWRASIMVDGKAIHLGRHLNYEDAKAARRKGEDKYFGAYLYRKHSDAK